MRYAIYFTPPSSDPLLKVAANWLGQMPLLVNLYGRRRSAIWRTRISRS